MLYGLPNRKFTPKDEEDFYKEIEKFQSMDEVYLTEELKNILDVIISIVLTKNRWLDPEGRECEARDMVQEVYLISESILRNVWRRRVNGPPIERLFSYLFRAVKNRIINYRTSQSRGLIYVEDFQEAVEFWEETSSIDALDPYIGMESKELMELFEACIRKIKFRLTYHPTCRMLLAAYWLRERFLEGLQISVYDLYHFDELTKEQKEFVFDYVDVCFRRVTSHFRSEYGDHKMNRVFSRFSRNHDFFYDANSSFRFGISSV